MLDPFRPERPEDVERLKRLQAQIHDNFIAQVKAAAATGSRDGDLFTGDIWVGQAGVAAGLADASATSCRPCARSSATRSPSASSRRAGR